MHVLDVEWLKLTNLNALAHGIGFGCSKSKQKDCVKLNNKLDVVFERINTKLPACFLGKFKYQFFYMRQMSWMC